MRILFVTSEANPFVKTGGLADICGSLPKALHAMGHDVRLVLPRYRSVDPGAFNLLPILPEMKVQFDGQTLHGEVLRTSYPGTAMPVYFIDLPELFDRDGVYNGPHGDFGDNDRRFGSFALAALWMLKGLEWDPQIIHLHDWPTGLIAPLLRHHHEVSKDDFFAKMRTVFTIHNMAYQGNFAPQLVADMGLPWSIYTSEGMEFYGRASMLKAGLAFSDFITTVSPTYAQEIMTPQFGVGLDGLLRARGDRFRGILNGIDAQVWNPQDDPHLAAPINPHTLAGKPACKAALQDMMGLPKKDVPLLAMVTRMTGQKGLDLFADAMPALLNENIQMVILGTGEPRFERYFSDIARHQPRKVATKIAYDESMSHRIIAGADIFLMPSAFEPCGLTQLYAMRYGTVPVVRHIGGLADTVIPATIRDIEAGRATGFTFHSYTPDAFYEAIKLALNLYKEDPPHWQKLQRNGMARDYSWQVSAKEYEKLYEGLAT